MSWNVEWGGRATDFMPEFLQTTGKPGRVARAAAAGIYEVLQELGNADPQAWVRAYGSGHEDAGNPGVGRLQITVEILGDEPSEIEQRIAAQQPIDLRA